MVRLNWKNIGLLVSWLILPISTWYAVVGQHKIMWIAFIVWSIYRHGDLLYKD